MIGLDLDRYTAAGRIVLTRGVSDEGRREARRALAELGVDPRLAVHFDTFEAAAALTIVQALAMVVRAPTGISLMAHEALSAGIRAAELYLKIERGEKPERVPPSTPAVREMSSRGVRSSDPNSATYKPGVD